MGGWGGWMDGLVVGGIEFKAISAKVEVRIEVEAELGTYQGYISCLP